MEWDEALLVLMLNTKLIRIEYDLVISYFNYLIKLVCT